MFDGAALECPDYRLMFKPLDPDLLFRLTSQTTDPVILNKLNFTTKGIAELLQESVYSRAGDLQYVPSCRCHRLEGSQFAGMFCVHCNHFCITDFGLTDRLPHTAWLEIPDFCPGVLHHIHYGVLTRWLGKKSNPNQLDGKKKRSTNYIDAILDPLETLPDGLDQVITGRGFQYFYENFDFIMDFFLNVHKTISKKPETPYVRYFLKQYRHLAFVNHLPIMSKVLHPLTSENGLEDAKKFADPQTQQILEAASDLACLYERKCTENTVYTDKVIFSVYKQYLEYLHTIAHKGMSEKASLPRHHMLGSRLHLTYRSVIIPIAGEHMMDSLHLPWKIAVNLFKIHIIGQLLQQGMTVGEAYAKQVTAVSSYDEDIHRLMVRMIRECPFPGLPTLFNRNPSL